MSSSSGSVASNHPLPFLNTALGWVPGLLLCGAITWVATDLAAMPWFRNHGLSALTIAIVIGMLVGNTVYGWVQAPTAAGA